MKNILEYACAWQRIAVPWRQVGSLQVDSGLLVYGGLDDWLPNESEAIQIPRGEWRVWVKYGRRSSPSVFTGVDIVRIVVCLGGPKRVVHETGSHSGQWVDSPFVVADFEAYLKHYESSGRERVGRVFVFPNDRSVADLLSAQFGFTYTELNPFSLEVQQEISKALEQEVVSYLSCFPKYSKLPGLHFHVYTASTNERIRGERRPYCMLPIGTGLSPDMAYVATGIHDGCSPVMVHTNKNDIYAVSVDYDFDSTEVYRAEVIARQKAQA